MWACEPGRTEALVRMFRENFLTLGSVLTLGVLVTHQSCNSFAITAITDAISSVSQSVQKVFTPTRGQHCTNDSSTDTYNTEQ